MKLQRSSKDKMIAGVCGGLAKELNIDPAILRLFVVFTTLIWGVGLVPYIVLWIVMPETDEY